jgi:hypothetical protein
MQTMRLSTKKAIRGALIAALLSVSGLASAGLKLSYPVNVGSNYASAGLGSARNSSDGTQYVDVVSTSNWAWFVFIDSSGNYGGCTSTDANVVAQARSVNQASHVDISWDGSGTCTNVTVRSGSYFETPVL